MKQLINSLFLMFLALVAVPVTYAQDDDISTEVETDPLEKKKSKSAKKGKELAAIPALLSNATFLTKKKPNLKAKYYGFIRSASWCVPCQIFVPQLLKDYSKMKGSKLELILLGQEDKAVVQKYMKEHGYKIPGAMPADIGDIPGLSYPNLGFPSMCIVDADGNFVAASGGVNMQKWKEQIKEYQTEQRKQKSKAAREAASAE